MEEHMTRAGGSLVTTHRIRVAALLAALAVILSSPGTSIAQSNQEPEEFTTFAVNMGTLTGGGTATLIITVNRWTSQADKDRLFVLLKEKGMQAFLDALQKQPRVGSLRTPNTVGYDLRFVTQEPGKDGGRRVLIATDRPVGFYEATNRPHSIEYPFTVIDMQLKPDGTGEGTMSIAAKFIPAGKTVIVENYDTQPVRLNKIETRKLTKK
jgi:hypothetical protein